MKYKYLNIILPKDLKSFKETIKDINDYFKLLLKEGKLSSILNSKVKRLDDLYHEDYEKEYNEYDFIVALNLRDGNIEKESFVDRSVEDDIKTKHDEIWWELDDFLNNFDFMINTVNLGLL